MHVLSKHFQAKYRNGRGYRFEESLENSETVDSESFEESHSEEADFDQTSKYLRTPCLKKSGRVFEHK
jgi:hypothetical protein